MDKCIRKTIPALKNTITGFGITYYFMHFTTFWVSASPKLSIGSKKLCENSQVPLKYTTSA